MDFYFVYSSGGGAGDWNAIDRIFQTTMPEYFKDHILIKFGDIFFNHRSSNSIIKPRNWSLVDDARQWLINNTGDQTLRTTPNLIMDVGTTKIVSYITASNPNLSCNQIVSQFDRIMSQERILEKYCGIVNTSNIDYAVTFDIPNLFKVRTQAGIVDRDIFSDPGTKPLLIDACVRYANEIYRGTGRNADKLLTIISAGWNNDDIEGYLSRLDYTPTKLGIGGLTDYNRSTMGERLQSIDSLVDFDSMNRVHFLGCGGLKKAQIIKEVLGNRSNFSVDNTTAYNRSIDGNTSGSSMSGYFDYASKDMIRICPDTKQQILNLHRASEDVAYFSVDEMESILDSILLHQSNRSSTTTYENRARLIIHNFDVFRYNAE